MAYTVADIEDWLGPNVTLDATIAARIKAAVDDWAARHYDLTTVTDEHDQALIMQCARLYRRRFSPEGVTGADELAPITIRAFDQDIARQLSGLLKTAGLFGPSANTAT